MSRKNSLKDREEMSRKKSKILIVTPKDNRE